MERKRLHTEEGFPRRKVHANLQVLTPTSLQRERRVGERQRKENGCGNWRDFLLGVYFLYRIGDKVIGKQEAREVAFPRGMRDGLGTCIKMARLWGMSGLSCRIG